MTKYTEEMIEKVRSLQPLVHCITNYVTVGDVANMILACGASPIMADSIYEAADIASLSSALVLNIGTLNERTVPAMIAAAESACQHNVPIILDPVGAGASSFRTRTVKQLMDSARYTIIRGNVSEIKALSAVYAPDIPIPGSTAAPRGVDVSLSDENHKSDNDVAVFAQYLAKKTGAVIVITGAADIVADADSIAIVNNGSPFMKKITGCGCMINGVIASFAATYPDAVFDAVTEAVCAMGICGEEAEKKAVQSEHLQNGLFAAGLFRQELFNAMGCMTSKIIKEKGRVNVLQK